MSKIVGLYQCKGCLCPMVFESKDDNKGSVPDSFFHKADGPIFYHDMGMSVLVQHGDNHSTEFKNRILYQCPECAKNGNIHMSIFELVGFMYEKDQIMN